MHHSIRRGRYADPSESIRFGSMRYIPPFFTLSPFVVRTTVPSAGHIDIPIGGSSGPGSQIQPGMQIWATQFQVFGGDAPFFVLNDNSTVVFAPNIVAVSAAGGAGNLEQWLVTVPANVKAIRVGGAGAVQFVGWAANNFSTNSAGQSGSSQPGPFTSNQIRNTHYAIVCLVGQNPRIQTPMNAIQAMGLQIGPNTALLAWQANPNVGANNPIVLNADAPLGYGVWYTDVRPPAIHW